MASISFSHLDAAIKGGDRVLLIDVRRRAAFESASDMASGALRRDPELVSSWRGSLPRASAVVVYCVHGHEVSRGVAQALRAHGLDAYYLEGGLEDGWKQNGGKLDAKAANSSTRWVTRERPKIDRIACPWLIARFIDPDASFLYVAPSQVREMANETGATPYDVPGVRFSHDGPLCSFDMFLEHYRLTDASLRQLAVIVRAADTGKLELAPQAPGLLAISLGLSQLESDDHVVLKHGMVMYDALYAWCKEGQDEGHGWNPEPMTAV